MDRATDFSSVGYRFESYRERRGDRSSVWLERLVVVQEVAGSNPVGHPPYLGEQLKYKIKNTSDFERQLDLKVEIKTLKNTKMRQ